jgi:hypothetical protein
MKAAPRWCAVLCQTKRSPRSGPCWVRYCGGFCVWAWPSAGWEWPCSQPTPNLQKPTWLLGKWLLAPALSPGKGGASCPAVGRVGGFPGKYIGYRPERRTHPEGRISAGYLYSLFYSQPPNLVREVVLPLGFLAVGSSVGSCTKGKVRAPTGLRPWAGRLATPANTSTKKARCSKRRAPPASATPPAAVTPGPKHARTSVDASRISTAGSGTGPHMPRRARTPAPAGHSRSDHDPVRKRPGEDATKCSLLYFRCGTKIRVPT